MQVCRTVRQMITYTVAAGHKLVLGSAGHGASDLETAGIGPGTGARGTACRHRAGPAGAGRCATMIRTGHHHAFIMDVKP